MPFLVFQTVDVKSFDANEPEMRSIDDEDMSQQASGPLTSTAKVHGKPKPYIWLRVTNVHFLDPNKLKGVTDFTDTHCGGGNKKPYSIPLFSEILFRYHL